MQSGLIYRHLTCFLIQHTMLFVYTRACVSREATIEEKKLQLSNSSLGSEDQIALHILKLLGAIDNRAFHALFGEINPR